MCGFFLGWLYLYYNKDAKTVWFSDLLPLLPIMLISSDLCSRSYKDFPR